MADRQIGGQSEQRSEAGDDQHAAPVAGRDLGGLGRRVGGGDQTAGGFGAQSFAFGVGEQAALGQVVDLRQLAAMQGQTRIGVGALSLDARAAGRARQDGGGRSGGQQGGDDPEHDHGCGLAD